MKTEIRSKIKLLLNCYSVEHCEDIWSNQFHFYNFHTTNKHPLTLLIQIIFTMLNYYSVKHCGDIWNSEIVSILSKIYQWKQATFHFEDQITTDKNKQIKRLAARTAVANSCAQLSAAVLCCEKLYKDIGHSEVE